MRKGRWLVALLLLLAFSHISCSWEKYEYPPGKVDEEKLAEALASREQENPPPLTMLQAYQIAQERATEWSDDSYLVNMLYSINTEQPYQYRFRTPNKWGWSCVGGPSYTDLDINVDPITGEITIFQEMGQSEILAGHIDPNTWNVDSPQALETAELSGGNAFKQEYPACTIQIVGYESYNGWRVVYVTGKPENGGEIKTARLMIEIDPYSGSTRIVEDTDGVSGEVVILGE
jgi:hypothetical protein